MERPIHAPRYRVVEESDAYRVTAWVPGVDKNGVEATIEGEELTIVARPVWQRPETWQPIHEETTPADYRLVLQLNGRVNQAGVRLELHQGVLTVTIPKAAATPPRRVEITG